MHTPSIRGLDIPVTTLLRASNDPLTLLRKYTKLQPLDGHIYQFWLDLAESVHTQCSRELQGERMSNEVNLFAQDGTIYLMILPEGDPIPDAVLEQVEPAGQTFAVPFTLLGLQPGIVPSDVKFAVCGGNPLARMEMAPVAEPAKPEQVPPSAVVKFLRLTLADLYGPTPGTTAGRWLSMLGRAPGMRGSDSRVWPLCLVPPEHLEAPRFRAAGRQDFLQRLMAWGKANKLPSLQLGMQYRGDGIHPMLQAALDHCLISKEVLELCACPAVAGVEMKGVGKFAPLATVFDTDAYDRQTTGLIQDEGLRRQVTQSGLVSSTTPTNRHIRAALSTTGSLSLAR